MPKYIVTISTGLAGCNRRLTVDTHSDLHFEDKDWDLLANTEKDKEIVNHCLERIIDINYTEIETPLYKVV